MRFELSYASQPSTTKFIDDNITPEAANRRYTDYQRAVNNAMMPNIDLDVARAQMEERLAAQGTEPLASLETTVPHPIHDQQGTVPDDEDMGPGYMTYEQELDYLTRLDNKLQREPMYIAPSMQKKLAGDFTQLDDKHWAELTPRELERQVELMNPQSQHNWLKIHKINSGNIGDDDNESLASHEPSKPPRKRGGKDKNLAKQVGDRAVERAREGLSPSAASDDDLPASAGRKRARDPDGTYRLKGAKTAASKGNKRKRSGGEELAAGKRRRVDGDEGEDDDGAYAA